MVAAYCFFSCYRHGSRRVYNRNVDDVNHRIFCGSFMLAELKTLFLCALAEFS